MKARILSSLAMALIPLSLCAAEPAARSTTAAADSATKPAATAAVATDSGAVKTDTPKARARCGDFTGSRIKPRKADGCEPIIRPSRTYTRDQMQTTGEIDTYEALRKLDPIFY